MFVPRPSHPKLAALAATLSLLLLCLAPAHAGSYQITSSGSGQVELWSDGDPLGSETLSTPVWSWASAMQLNPDLGAATRIRLTYTETFQYVWQPDYPGEPPVPHEVAVTADVVMPHQLNSGGMQYSGQATNDVAVGGVQFDATATFTAPSGPSTDDGTEYFSVSDTVAISAESGSFPLTYVAEAAVTTPFMLLDFEFSAGLDMLWAAPAAAPEIFQVSLLSDPPILTSETVNLKVDCQNLTQGKAYRVRTSTHLPMRGVVQLGTANVSGGVLGTGTAQVTWTPDNKGVYKLVFVLEEWDAAAGQWVIKHHHVKSFKVGVP